MVAGTSHLPTKHPIASSPGIDPDAVNYRLERWASIEARRRLLDLAIPQYGLVARRQLLGAGFTSSQVEWAAAQSHLLTVCPGVYALGRPIATERAIFMAGVLAAGPGAVLSRNSAARLWGFNDRGDRVDAVRLESRKPRVARLSAPGSVVARSLLVRRTRHLPDHHVTSRHGIPVTTTERALLDLSSDLSEKLLSYRFLEADRLGLIDDQRLGQILLDGFGHKGIAKLRRLAKARHPDVKRAKSLLEALLQRCADRWGLPRPETNVWIGKYRVDFYWKELGLVIETDGTAFHAGQIQVTRDIERENFFKRQGIDVLRITWRELEEQEDLTMDLIEKTIRGRIARNLPSITLAPHDLPVGQRSG